MDRGRAGSRKKHLRACGPEKAARPLAARGRVNETLGREFIRGRGIRARVSDSGTRAGVISLCS